MIFLGGRKSRNKVIVGEPAIGSFVIKTYCNKLVACQIYYKDLIYPVTEDALT